MRISRRHSATRKHFPANADILHVPFLGTPWVRGGRERVLGMDCLGLVVVWLQSTGLAIVDPCSTDPQEVIGSEFRSQFLPVSQDCADFGDVVRFKVRDEFHLGIILFDGLLQATKRHGVHIAPLPSDADCKFYRHKTIVAMMKCEATPC